MSRCREEGSGRAAAKEEEEALQEGAQLLSTPPRCQNTCCVSVLQSLFSPFQKEESVVEIKASVSVHFLAPK